MGGAARPDRLRCPRARRTLYALAVNRRKERFRRVSTQQTGDLFQHYDVVLESSAEPEDPNVVSPILDATPCRTCGWYRTSKQCPLLCGP